MPAQGERDEALGQLDLVLNQLRPLGHIPLYKELYEAELARKQVLEKVRAKAAGQGESQKELVVEEKETPVEEDKSEPMPEPELEPEPEPLKAVTSETIEAILSQPADKFKADFRMSRGDMQREVFGKFALHTVFESDDVKEQGKAEYQLAVCIYRLAQPPSVTLKSIADKFEISPEYVQEWINRSLTVLLSFQTSYISWPLPPERILISQAISSKHTLPDCVGFLDGFHIRLQRGAQPNIPLPEWHPDNRIGLNVLGVADNEGRIRWVDLGYSSDPKADVSQLDRMPWNVKDNERRWFDSKQVVIADKGFRRRERVLSLYDIGAASFIEKTDGEAILADQRSFNSRASLPLHETVQLAWGRLKGRFQYFSEAVIPDGEQERPRDMVAAAIMLHNMLLKNVGEFVSTQEAEKLVQNERYAEKWVRD
ncbi:hypothetical protein L198_04025 [Cryptococcus wingfieldii CBS 7118]|uniref:DDE Tnp4 domain-containing protein n=1 Tax=Cryptococcus wingfieldii CBS 7118 TaxID=1295528 RepID=A0A1E3JC21_9TREE|nr:hypothetical protein L198_04025 [Cryptococcus wingfieldii CBS 7118]ODN97461.1 hypothetical protein L198_04025 [Cryptococcus wingfieldii CBS 7118]